MISFLKERWWKKKLAGPCLVASKLGTKANNLTKNQELRGRKTSHSAGETSKKDDEKCGGKTEINSKQQSASQTDENLQAGGSNQARNHDKRKGKENQVMGDDMKVASKSEGLNEKVHIPDDFHESGAESESLSDRLRKIDVYVDTVPSSQENESTENQQAWQMAVGVDQTTEALMLEQKLSTIAKNDLQGILPIKAQMGLMESQTELRAEGGENDEILINSQESVITDDGKSLHQ